MTKVTWTNRATIAVGGIVVASAIAAPALAVDYPPPVSPSSTPSTTSGSTTAADATARTGSNATVFGLLAGLAAVGVGGGLVVASRRKNA